VGAVAPLASIWRLSQGWYHDRLDLGYRPPSIEHLQALLDDCGLTSEFWQLTKP